MVGGGADMTMNRIRFAINSVVSDGRVCWMKSSDTQRISIMAIIPETIQKAKAEGKSCKLADKAEYMAQNEAKRMGQILSAGVFMGGNEVGSITATGVADIQWSQEVEDKLNLCGMPQLV